jgi:hypothetical protein
MKFTKNETTILKPFLSGAVRKDHYGQGRYPYRFAAFYLPEDRDHLFDIIQKYINLPVPPSKIFIFNDANFPGYPHCDYLHLYWESNANLVINSDFEYLQLAREFAQFIDDLADPKLTVDDGSYDDDPDVIHPDLPVVEDPHFNAKAFGPISFGSVIDLRDEKYSVRLYKYGKFID